jgi:hypothetical protein
MRRALALGILLVAAIPAHADPAPDASPPAPDVFAEAVHDAGLTASDLGFRGKGTWNRFPNPPYKMPFFDDLLADATSTYEFTRTLGSAVEDLLTPEKLRAAPDKDAPENLYKLAVLLATDRRIGGFRGFGFGLLSDTVPEGDQPLRTALTAIWTSAGQKPPAFADTSKVPVELQRPVARLILDLVDAHEWIERGLRRVTAEQRKEVFALLPKLATSTPDATTYFPILDDVAREIDEHSLYFGCLKAVAATSRARRGIEAVKPTAGWPASHFEVDTPWGSVEIRTQSLGGPPSFDPLVIADGVLLLVDLSGSAREASGIGATSANRSLSIALLFGASSVEQGKGYQPDTSFWKEWSRPSVAAGVLGCGIAYSAGDSSTSYNADSWGLGAGLFGLGMLVDEGGDDSYSIREMGEGAAYFGAGLLLDAAGNDRYELRGGDGQGHGGPNGIGVLADRSGNDRYYAEPRPEKAGTDRGDYHSDQKIVSSNAQGAGFGRRGDLTDGHAWAGGLGALIDVDGDDVYEAGNFSQGCGYWFGTGLLWDGGGNDVYRSVYFSHGSGAHFAVGAVIDEGGDDQHLLFDWPKVGLGPKAGAGIGFGWDVVNALCLDRGGNDRYEADIISLGCAEVRSHAWLIDEAGDDTYVTNAGSLAFAAVDELPTYVTPHRTSPFAFHLPQSALLLDLGGTDRYLRRPAGGGESVADDLARDGASWGHDGPRGPGGGANVARGRDVARGRIGWLDAWPRRVARAR